MDIRRNSVAPIGSNPLKPLLICFSHLRWSCVWQRPQHLLSRAARDYRVLFIEEPLVSPAGEPHLDLSTGPGAITIAVLVLPAEVLRKVFSTEQIASQAGERVKPHRNSRLRPRF